MTAAKPAGSASQVTGRENMPRSPDSGWMGRELDDVFAAFHEVLPDYGLKLVFPPPLPDGSRGQVSLSAWRRGETRADVHSAATASQALAMMLQKESASRGEMLSRKTCPKCRGLGWYIGTGGATAICVHANAQAD